MARLVIGSTDVPSAGTPVQIASDEDRVIWAKLKSNENNGGNVYIGISNSVSSTNGWSLGAGEEIEIPITFGHSILRSTFWVDAASNGYDVDWAFLLST